VESIVLSTLWWLEAIVYDFMPPVNIILKVVSHFQCTTGMHVCLVLVSIIPYGSFLMSQWLRDMHRCRVFSLDAYVPYGLIHMAVIIIMAE
jgi:hypothetical protein